MKLKSTPKAPTEPLPVFLMYQEGTHPESWRDYLISAKYWNSELAEV